MLSFRRFSARRSGGRSMTSATMVFASQRFDVFSCKNQSFRGSHRAQCSAKLTQESIFEQFLWDYEKRHNSAPWAPDEASPYLNESSRCAESESEEHFVRKAHFSAHVWVKKCYFPVNKKNAKLGRNQVSAQCLGLAWRQDQDAGLKSWIFDLEK